MSAGMDVAQFIAGIVSPGEGKTGFGGRMEAGVKSLAEGYGNYITQQKQLTAAGKAGKYYFDANPDALLEMGKTPEEAKNFGAQDWASLAQAHSEQQTLAQMLAQTKALVQRTTADQQELTANRNFTQMFNGQRPTAQSMAAMMIGQGPVRNRTETPMDIARMMLDSGQAPDKVMGHLAQLQGDEENNLIYDRASIPGNTVVKTKRGNGFQVVPTGGSAPEPVTEENNKTIGYMINGKFVRGERAGASYIEVPDPENPVFGPKIRMSLEEAAKNYPDLLKGLKPGSKAPAAAEAPTDPKQRKANTTYKTPKGELEWTGTGWVHP